MNKEKKAFLAKQNYIGMERRMALPNRMSLRPCLLRLSLNLALIIQFYHEIIFLFKFTCPVRCFRIPSKMSLSTPRGTRISGEDSWFTLHGLSSD
jgi:hypothetical protein